ncbi:MAG: hypothetical protein PWQ88_1102 [Candidatus Methanomethylophilaceae archaeon]|nr:MAG: Uncharacterized protein XE11_2129 [Methanomicrobiales archaeon 53_19]MDI3483231.1 hypothetical protein [Candidatus Methanomethylophilaceae archaeon]MDI3542371.1 hypothetical protein [Candidatus Methanomethylophilaceae archaeon]
MQDPRLRILCTVLLSVGSFISPVGAVATLVWWLLFTTRLRALPHPRTVVGIIIMIAVTALVSELSGGEGLPYLIRMIPILLVAMWAYSDRNEGELLDVSVWMFGKGIGFDMGLMAEMGMQSLSQIAHDLSRIRQAMIIKGMKPSIRVIIPMATNIVVNQLRRAEGIAKLLRVRGYRGGGELKPRFMTERRDMVLTISAMIVLVLAILGYY